MAETWPPTLPQAPLVERFRAGIGDTRVRSSMAQGPAKVRRTTTAGVGAYTIPLVLTAAQLLVLIDFYEDTLEGGSLPFDFSDDILGSIELRPLPTSEGLLLDWERVGDDAYRVLLPLEVMP